MSWMLICQPCDRSWQLALPDPPVTVDAFIAAARAQARCSRCGNIRVAIANDNGMRAPGSGKLDPVRILNQLAAECSRGRAGDAAFWILSSAAAYQNGYAGDDAPSTVATWWSDGNVCAETLTENIRP